MARMVHLKRHHSNHLLVAACVCNTAAGQESDPLKFIVDTASERSFIAPACVKAIESVCGPLYFDPKDRVQATTMVGPLEYEASGGFHLVFECVDGKEFPVTPKHGQPRSHGHLCFAAEGSPLANGLRGADGLPFNILGRDVLNQATLVVPPSNKDAYLFFEFDLGPKLREIEKHFLQKEQAPKPKVTLHYLTDEQALSFEPASERRPKPAIGARRKPRAQN